MKINKSHNEEIPSDDLFRDVFVNHKEPVDEKDFDQFMGQLENTGFFKNEIKYLGFYIFAFMVFTGSLWYALIPLRKDITEGTALSVSEKKSTEIVAEPGLGKSVDSDITSPIKTFSNAKAVSHKINKTPNNTSPSETVVDEKIRTVEEVLFINDSLTLTNPSVKEKISKDSVRVQYVIQVDTIKTIDSLSIKKRKWEKMKGKK